MMTTLQSTKHTSQNEIKDKRRFPHCGMSNAISSFVNHGKTHTKQVIKLASNPFAQI